MDEVDLCVIGSGSGNSLVDDRFQGLRVALVDDGRHFGGTCLNSGCIPTKMMVLPADLATSVTEAARLGVDLEFVRARWGEIRDRIFRDRIDQISTSGLAWREQQDHVAVHRQRAHFIDPHTVELTDGHRIRARHFVLAAGSRPRVPAVPGLADSPDQGRPDPESPEPSALQQLVHTSDTIMRIAELPGRLVVLGAGFVAAEFAHVFAAFGVEVTIVHRGDRLLRKADDEISHRFTAHLGRRVHLALGETLVAVEHSEAGEVVVRTRRPDGSSHSHTADLLLNATGRVPNSDRLELAAAGVEVDADGFVQVDQHQRTSQPHIWAIGDVCSPAMLKHVANHEMRTVQTNLSHELLGQGAGLVASNHHFIPSAVFSEPQVGQVGATEADLISRGQPYLCHVQEYGSVAYGWALEDEDSCVKLLADPATRTLLGAHVIGPQAATLVQQCIQAMALGTDIDTMARGQYWIHPALPEVIENCLLELAASEPVNPVTHPASPARAVW